MAGCKPFAIISGVAYLKLISDRCDSLTYYHSLGSFKIFMKNSNSHFFKHLILLLLSILYLPDVLGMKYPTPSKLSFTFRQAFNLPGIKAFFNVARNPRLCLPSIDLISLRDLDCVYLKNSGIRAVIFDKDNTLR